MREAVLAHEAVLEDAHTFDLKLEVVFDLSRRGRAASDGKAGGVRTTSSQDRFARPRWRSDVLVRARSALPQLGYEKKRKT